MNFHLTNIVGINLEGIYLRGSKMVVEENYTFPAARG